MAIHTFTLELNTDSEIIGTIETDPAGTVSGVVLRDAIPQGPVSITERFTGAGPFVLGQRTYANRTDKNTNFEVTGSSGTAFALSADGLTITATGGAAADEVTVVYKVIPQSDIVVRPTNVTATATMVDGTDSGTVILLKNGNNGGFFQGATLSGTVTTNAVIESIII